ncbi:MAG: hypothetical protein ACC656_14185, partial [Candidatus Heimdallarchaeota archaeon]
YTPSNDFLSWKITGINGTPDPSNLTNINSTDPNAIDFPIGKFNIKLNAENNCKTKSDSINIEVHALPIVDAGEGYNGCVEIEIDIDNATTNAIQPQYIWSVLNDGPLPVPNDSLSTKIISSTNGDFDYQLYVKDKYGCSAVDSTTVFVEALPVIKIISTKLEFCKDETDIILTASPIGGIWNGDAIDAFGNVNTKIPDKYIVNYSYITQSINQCQADTNVVFVVNKLPIVDLSPIDTIHCSNLSDILDLDIYNYTTKTSILGTGTWTGKNVTNTGKFDLSSNGNFLLNYEYTESSTGCVNDQNIMLEVGNETLLDLGPNEQFCFGQPFTVSQAQPLGGEWSIAGQFGAVVSPDGIISATKDG